MKPHDLASHSALPNLNRLAQAIVERNAKVGNESEFTAPFVQVLVDGEGLHLEAIAMTPEIAHAVKALLKSAWPACIELTQQLLDDQP